MCRLMLAQTDLLDSPLQQPSQVQTSISMPLQTLQVLRVLENQDVVSSRRLPEDLIGVSITLSCPLPCIGRRELKLRVVLMSQSSAYQSTYSVSASALPSRDACVPEVVQVSRQAHIRLRGLLCAT